MSRKEEEKKKRRRLMLRDAGSTSTNRRSKNRPGAAGLWGVVTGGDGGQSEPGICDGGTIDPPMIRCHPGGALVWYGTVW